MIPDIEILTEEITETEYGSNTYRIVKNTRSVDVGQSEYYDKIDGYIDDLEAIKQAIYLILSTERYQHIIYSWDYGVELIDLYGKPMPYVISELERRITEALTQDDRIEDVTDFEFEQKGKRLHTTFTVVTTVGEIPTDMEVEV